MNTMTGFQVWLEAQNKESKVILSQSDMRMIEMSLSLSILDVLGKDEQSIDDRIETVDRYRAVRDKIEAHIVR